MIEASAENVETLLFVFLDGYVSGFSTALYNTGAYDEDRAEIHAQALAHNALHDPAVAETMRDHIRARLAGGYGENTNLPINWEV